MARKIKIPNTPESQAFTRYGNTDVNMYTGTPNVSIPLYIISGRELDLPVSLSYDASGVKVTQIATQAGLGWNLNVGGRISRIVNGLVDDYISSSPGYASSGHPTSAGVETPYMGLRLKDAIAAILNPPSSFPTQQDGLDYFQFLKDINNNNYDTQPDYFSLNVLGINDYLVFDGTNFVALNNPRIKVDVTYSPSQTSLETFVITGEDGTKYYFNVAEKTYTQSQTESANSIMAQEYNSSWLLTRIVSPNGMDEYDFDYINLGKSTSQPESIVTSINNTISDSSDDSLIPENTGFESSVSTLYNVSQCILKEIRHNDTKIVDFMHKVRYDIRLDSGTPNSSAIDKINIYSRNGVNAFKKYVFNHSYFGDISTSADKAPFYEIRLKLDSIVIQSENDNTLSSYAFEYFSPTAVPSRISKSRDYLGYYNGVNNEVLYPAVQGLSGGDRSPSFDHAKIGTLSKITYPTKGYTEFTYEPHGSTYTQEDIEKTKRVVSYGGLSLKGGEGSGTDICLIDKYGHYPLIRHGFIYVSEADTYDVSYSNTTGDGEAYLFFRTGMIQEKGFPPDPEYLSYNEIIDQTDGLCSTPLVTLAWSNVGTIESGVYLEPGIYQITLVKGDYPGGSGTISLSLSREEVEENITVGTGEVIRAGLRIKSIRDYSNVNTLASEKEYRYTTTLNGLTSSGEQVFRPSFYSINEVSIVKGDGTYADIRTMTRLTSWSGGDRPHIAYGRVFEIQKNGNETNGYIEHNFNVGSMVGLITEGISYYDRDFDVGKESQINIKSADNLPLETTNVNYQQSQYFGMTTIYPYSDREKMSDFLRIFYDPDNNVYRYDYVSPQYFAFPGLSNFFKGGDVSSAPFIAQLPPPPICDPPNFCYTDFEYSALGTRITYAQGKIGGVSSQEKVVFSDGYELRQLKQYFYHNGSMDYLLDSIITNDSKGNTIITKQFYPKSFSDEAPYSTLVDRNRLTEIVQSEKYLLNKGTLSRQRIKYRELGGLLILPDTIQIAKGDNPWENKVVFSEYYVEGNPKEVIKSDGIKSIYIWGYEKTKVIAKVDNLNGSLSATTISNLQSLSDADIDDQTENDLRVALEDLRSQYPEAMITTYTYDPGIGLTSATDHNGLTTYYEYDDHNRIYLVKNSRNEIIKKYSYNYKND